MLLVSFDSLGHDAAPCREAFLKQMAGMRWLQRQRWECFLSKYSIITCVTSTFENSTIPLLAPGCLMQRTELMQHAVMPIPTENRTCCQQLAGNYFLVLALFDLGAAVVSSSSPDPRTLPGAIDETESLAPSPAFP
jgi:hypothetical protein